MLCVYVLDVLSTSPNVSVGAFLVPGRWVECSMSEKSYEHTGRIFGIKHLY